MKRTSVTIRITSIGLVCGLLWSASTAVALAQTAAPPEVPATLNAIDFNFVGQANLLQGDFADLSNAGGPNRITHHNQAS